RGGRSAGDPGDRRGPEDQCGHRAANVPRTGTACSLVRHGHPTASTIEDRDPPGGTHPGGPVPVLSPGRAGVARRFPTFVKHSLRRLRPPRGLDVGAGGDTIAPRPRAAPPRPPPFGPRGLPP